MFKDKVLYQTFITTERVSRGCHKLRTSCTTERNRRNSTTPNTLQQWEQKPPFLGDPGSGMAEIRLDQLG